MKKKDIIKKRTIKEHEIRQKIPVDIAFNFLTIKLTRNQKEGSEFHKQEVREKKLLS